MLSILFKQKPKQAKAYESFDRKQAKTFGAFREQALSYKTIKEELKNKETTNHGK